MQRFVKQNLSEKQQKVMQFLAHGYSTYSLYMRESKMSRLSVHSACEFCRARKWEKDKHHTLMFVGSLSNRLFSREVAILPMFC